MMYKKSEDPIDSDTLHLLIFNLRYLRAQAKFEINVQTGTHSGRVLFISEPGNPLGTIMFGMKLRFAATQNYPFRRILETLWIHTEEVLFK